MRRSNLHVARAAGCGEWGGLDWTLNGPSGPYRDFRCDRRCEVGPALRRDHTFQPHLPKHSLEICAQGRSHPTPNGAVAGIRSPEKPHRPATGVPAARQRGPALALDFGLDQAGELLEGLQLGGFQEAHLWKGCKVGKPIARLENRYGAGPRRPQGIAAARSSVQEPWGPGAGCHRFTRHRPSSRTITPPHRSTPSMLQASGEPSASFAKSSIEVRGNKRVQERPGEGYRGGLAGGPTMF